MNIFILETEPTDVVRIVAENGVDGAAKAMSELEAHMDSLKGRSMYGVYFPDKEEYSACLKIDDEHPDDFGLERWTIPGGKYARTKLKNWHEHLEELGTLFPELGRLAVAQGFTVDTTRPNIEHYRSLEELHLLVPIS